MFKHYCPRFKLDTRDSYSSPVDAPIFGYGCVLRRPKNSSKHSLYEMQALLPDQTCKAKRDQHLVLLAAIQNEAHMSVCYSSPFSFLRGYHSVRT